jgi:hypothetical protein
MMVFGVVEDVMSNPNPNDRPTSPSQGGTHTIPNERMRSFNEDHRRTTQRAPLSNTSDWRAVFLMGGWRLALALVLIFFIMVLLFVLRGSAESAAPVSTDPATVQTPQATLFPTMTVAAGEQVRVSGTGDSGLFLRKEPSRTAEPIKTLPEGTVLAIIGANKTVDDIVWRNVRDAAGSEGWVSASYVVANQ